MPILLSRIFLVVTTNKVFLFLAHLSLQHGASKHESGTNRSPLSSLVVVVGGIGCIVDIFRFRSRQNSL